MRTLFQNARIDRAHPVCGAPFGTSTPGRRDVTSGDLDRESDAAAPVTDERWKGGQVGQLETGRDALRNMPLTPAEIDALQKAKGGRR